MFDEFKTAASHEGHYPFGMCQQKQIPKYGNNSYFVESNVMNELVDEFVQARRGGGSETFSANIIGLAISPIKLGDNRSICGICRVIAGTVISSVPISDDIKRCFFERGFYLMGNEARCKSMVLMDFIVAVGRRVPGAFES